MPSNDSDINVSYNVDDSSFKASMQSAKEQVNDLSQSLDRLKNKLNSGSTINPRDVANWRKAEQSAREIARLASQHDNTSGSSMTARNSQDVGSGARAYQEVTRQLTSDFSRGMQDTINQLNRQFSEAFNNRSIKTRSAYSGRVRNGQTGQQYVSEMQDRLKETNSNERARSNNAEYRNIMNSMNRYTNVVQSHGGVISNVDYTNMQRTRQRAQSQLYDNDGNSVLTELNKSRSELQSNIAKRVDNVTQNYGNDKDLSPEQEREKALELESIRLMEKRNAALDKQIRGLEELESQYNGSFSEEALGGVRRVTPNRQSGIFQTYNAVGGALRNGTSQGVSMYYQNMPNSRNLAAAQGSYNSQSIRRQADNAGNRYGLSGTEMMGYESAYVLGAGYQSDEDVTQAGVLTGRLGRRTGATSQDAEQLTSNYALGTNGANAQSLSQWQQVFEGGLKNSGMTRNGVEQLRALSSLTANVTQNGGGSLSQRQMTNLASTQAMFASTGDKAFQGQAGANAISQFDSGLRNTQNTAQQLALMQSNPEKYNGSAEGVNNMYKTMQEGITSNDGLNAALNMAQNTFGDKTGLAANYINQNYGTNMTSEQYQKLQDARRKNGGKFDEKTLQEAGISEQNNKNDRQMGSEDSRIDRSNAAMETANAKLGAFQQGLTSSLGALVGFNAELVFITRSLGGLAPRLAQNAVGNAVATGGKGTGGGGAAAAGAAGAAAEGGAAAAGAGGLAAGGIASRLRNSRVGNAVANSSMFGTLRTGAGRLAGSRVGQAGAGILSTVAGSRLGQGAGRAASGGAGLLRRGLSSSRALPLVGTALGAASLVPQLLSDDSNENKGSGIASLIGGGIGAALGSVVPGVGTAVGGVAGGVLGSMAGGAIGGGIGRHFDNGNEAKNADALESKRASNEDKRARNIKDDTSLEQGKSRDGSRKGGKGGSRESADGEGAKSPFEEVMGKPGKGWVDLSKAYGEGSGAQTNSDNSVDGGTVNVVLSGNVTHSGTVSDVSDVNASITAVGNSVVNQIFNTPLKTNETRRR